MLITKNKDFSNGEYVAVKVGGKWVWPGDKSGPAAMSKLFQSALDKVPAAAGPELLSELCHSLACTYRGTGRIVLSGDFRKRELHGSELLLWLGEAHKNSNDLTKYVADPRLQVDPWGYVITYCVITMQGAVERWKIRCEKFQHAVIQKIEITVEEKAGTFGYPIAG